MAGARKKELFLRLPYEGTPALSRVMDPGRDYIPGSESDLEKKTDLDPTLKLKADLDRTLKITRSGLIKINP